MVRNVDKHAFPPVTGQIFLERIINPPDQRVLKFHHSIIGSPYCANHLRVGILENFPADGRVFRVRKALFRDAHFVVIILIQLFWGYIRVMRSIGSHTQKLWFLIATPQVLLGIFHHIAVKLQRRRVAPADDAQAGRPALRSFVVHAPLGCKRFVWSVMVDRRDIPGNPFREPMPLIGPHKVHPSA